MTAPHLVLKIKLTRIPAIVASRAAPFPMIWRTSSVHSTACECALVQTRVESDFTVSEDGQCLQRGGMSIGFKTRLWSVCGEAGQQVATSTLRFNKWKLQVTLWLYAANAGTLLVLHAIIWNSHLTLPTHWWCISSLIKAVCCDAFNINHIQYAGRI